MDSGYYSEFYSVDGTTIIPGLDFNGTLMAPVYVNDGEEESSQSNVFDLEVNDNFKPQCLDGEVEKFELMDWKKVFKLMKKTNSIKNNSNFVDISPKF